MKKNRVSISWSGGKDSSYMLWLMLSNEEFEVVELHTLINAQTKRVGLHGVHMDLITAQAKSIGISIRFLEIDSSNSNTEYEKALKQYYTELKTRNIDFIAFGDIFLEDLKKYRDVMLKNCQMQGIYPLWQQNTRKLARSFLDNGFKSVICASDSSKFKETIAGQFYTLRLVDSFPKKIDPCGENGEFHSFVYDGPIFKHPVQFEKKHLVEKHYRYKNSEGNEIKDAFVFSELKLTT